MKSYSARESFPLWSLAAGEPYNAYQNTSQTRPMTPVKINAHSQPQAWAMYGTVSGATIAPTFAPELYRPVANARSFFGNHSAIALFAAGKLPASVMPSAARQNPKLQV